MATIYLIAAIPAIIAVMKTLKIILLYNTEIHNDQCFINS
jgi:hypothetical protein